MFISIDPHAQSQWHEVAYIFMRVEFAMELAAEKSMVNMALFRQLLFLFILVLCDLISSLMNFKLFEDWFLHLSFKVLWLNHQHDELSKPIGAECEFIFLRLNILREYLERELRMDNLPFKYDFEVGGDCDCVLHFFIIRVWNEGGWREEGIWCIQKKLCAFLNKTGKNLGMPKRKEFLKVVIKNLRTSCFWTWFLFCFCWWCFLFLFV